MVQWVLILNVSFSLWVFVSSSFSAACMLKFCCSLCCSRLLSAVFLITFWASVIPVLYFVFYLSGRYASRYYILPRRTISRIGIAFRHAFAGGSHASQPSVEFRGQSSSRSNAPSTGPSGSPSPTLVSFVPSSSSSLGLASNRGASSTSSDKVCSLALHSMMVHCHLFFAFLIVSPLFFDIGSFSASRMQTHNSSSVSYVQIGASAAPSTVETKSASQPCCSRLISWIFPNAGESIFETIQEFLAAEHLRDGEDILSRTRAFSHNDDDDTARNQAAATLTAAPASIFPADSNSFVGSASSPMSPKPLAVSGPDLQGFGSDRIVFDETTATYAGLSSQDAFAGLCGLGDDYTRMGKLRYWFLSEYHVEVRPLFCSLLFFLCRLQSRNSTSCLPFRLYCCRFAEDFCSNLIMKPRKNLLIRCTEQVCIPFVLLTLVPSSYLSTHDASLFSRYHFVSRKLLYCILLHSLFRAIQSWYTLSNQLRVDQQAESHGTLDRSSISAVPKKGRWAFTLCTQIRAACSRPYCLCQCCCVYASFSIAFHFILLV